jgi:chromosome segregation protein
MQQAESVRAGLAAEERALAELLEPAEADLFPPLIDAVTVQAGWEAALGAALGEDLNAPADEAAPVHWTSLPPLEPAPLPGGAPPLAEFVTAPNQLNRRLASIGVVEDMQAGARLAGELSRGQRLVSRDGALWRWDGYTIAAGAPTAAATRLAQRNRLAEVRDTLKAAKKDAEAAGAAALAARQARDAAAAGEQAAREATRSDFALLTAARDEHARLAQARAAVESRLAALVEALDNAASDLSDAQAQAAAARDSLAAPDDPAKAADAVGALRTELAELRSRQTERRSAHDRLAAEAERRGERLRAIESEAGSWRQRGEGTQNRLADLSRRRAEAEGERDRLAARPAEIEAQRGGLMDRLTGAEAARGAAADRLAAGETAQAEGDRALKSAEAALSGAREEQVRAEARLEQATHERDSVVQRIREKLDVAPERILESASIGAREALPESADAAARLERLVRERDNMGPVNLRAEVEAAELEAQVASLRTEREDLLAAIARLRQGIGSLNREGRERLMAAFTQVNEHFEKLFTRLFGGGRAYLTLTDADEPLDVGLEIMASPPGKKLTAMSLLSGGEQALTAVALLFAVFLTNPAPICVLDEVDAPLDDSNVDRFCALVGDIASSGETRFLLVTHHRMTMARMDRLFGVTMGEAGVSQLVSVDLSGAEALRELA